MNHINHAVYDAESNSFVFANGGFPSATSKSVLFRGGLDAAELLKGKYSDEPVKVIQRHIAWLADDVESSKSFVDAIRAEYDEAVQQGIGWHDGPYTLLVPDWVQPGHCKIKPDAEWEQKDDGHRPNLECFSETGDGTPDGKNDWKKRHLVRKANGELSWKTGGTFKKAAKPTKEQLAWADKVTGFPRELEDLKRRPTKKNEPALYTNNPFGDDEHPAPPEHDHVFVEEVKTTNPIDLAAARVWTKYKADSGKYGLQVDVKNKEFIRDKMIYEWVLENPSKDPDDDGQWLKATAAKLGLTISGVRTLIKDFKDGIKVMEETKNGKNPKFADAPKLTSEQLDDIIDGTSYILVKLAERSSWTWYKLDIKEWGSEAMAIEALKREKLDSAWAARLKKEGIKAKDTISDHPTGRVLEDGSPSYKFWDILADVKEGIDKAFLPANIHIVHGRRWIDESE